MMASMLTALIAASGFASGFHGGNPDGHSEAIQGTPPILRFNTGGGQPACYNNPAAVTWREWFTVANGAGAAPWTVTLTVTIYQWVVPPGARGNLLATQTVQLTANPGQTVSMTVTLNVVYNGWNGGTSCGATFELYRQMTDGPNFNSASVVL